MTNDALAQLWNSSANRPAAETGERLAAGFVARMRRRRRFQAWWLAWTFFALTGVTGVVIAQLVKHGFDHAATPWALGPMLALPWVAAFIFLRQFRRERATPGSSISPLQQVVVAAGAHNRAECRRLRAIAALLGAMVPVSGLVIWQLYVAGKATVDQAWSMALVFGIGLALGGGFSAWRYRYRLVPERHALDALLRDLELPETC